MTLNVITPLGDKSEYVNPYIPAQSPEEDWSDHMQNHQADSPLYVWPDVWSADLHLLIKSMVIHDAECPYWDQVSLNNTNQTKPHWDQVPLNSVPSVQYRALLS